MARIVLPEPPPSDGVVTLREWRDEDAAGSAAAMRHPDIPRYIPIPQPYTEDHARAFFLAARTKQAAGEELHLAVVDARSGALRGAVGLSAISALHRSAEVGYWTAPEARREGVAVRAVSLLTAWAFDSLGLERVALLAEPENRASQRVAERAGFTREGVLRALRELRGVRRDYVSFSRLRDDPPPR